MKRQLTAPKSRQPKPVHADTKQPGFLARNAISIATLGGVVAILLLMGGVAGFHLVQGAAAQIQRSSWEGKKEADIKERYDAAKKEHDKARLVNK